MTEPQDVIDVEEVKTPKAGRANDGGAYLIIADDSDEFLVALRYAAQKAVANRANIIIAYIVNVDDFVHWQNLEKMMKNELRDQAEKFLWNAAKIVNDISGLMPVFYIREGNNQDEIVKIIEEDESVRSLVLGGKVDSSSPGSLVSYFTGKGFARLHVPVMIVPGDLEQKGLR
ncbi:MAG: universal stress protein [Alphaproteobacteria bacterium]|jgi:hypothetical protein|nr:universal stress protein [Alphaproteobacteria bacterium]MDP7222868.1 universal stress protein [Alphaproteobacteria bacterium]